MLPGAPGPPNCQPLFWSMMPAVQPVDATYPFSQLYSPFSATNAEFAGAVKSISNAEPPFA